MTHKNMDLLLDGCSSHAQVLQVSKTKCSKELSTTSIGIEADKIREMFNSGLAALRPAGMQLPVSDLAFLQELYARSRVM